MVEQVVANHLAGVRFSLSAPSDTKAPNDWVPLCFVECFHKCPCVELGINMFTLGIKDRNS